jgi:GrpB-like predicted nucleotidyltransferase (UPF0157 family)
MYLLLEQYNPAWKKEFEQLKQVLLQTLNGLQVTIEHVGSTSVPQLDAKPIIDIDIIYVDGADFEKIKAKLIEVGYSHNGNQGIPEREVFKRNGEYNNKVLDTIKHHLYACPVESNALERHLLSRNFLRKNEWARVKYQQMKYDLAEKANQNRKRYAELKELYLNDFIDSMIEDERNSMQ